MRLLLDAHVSGRRVGRPLRAASHDVLALDEEPALEGLSDEDVLELGWKERHILVTHNVADFPPLLREWAELNRSHAGVIVVYGIDHSEHGILVRGIRRWLASVPDQQKWIDLPAVLDRGFASG